MAVDWSEFPKVLLQLVFEKLNSEFYQLSFRYVCSPWRSSVPQNHHHLNLLTSTIQIHSNNMASTFPLFKRTLFLISPPSTEKVPKLRLVSQDRSRLTSQKLPLLEPSLTWQQTPSSFPWGYRFQPILLPPSRQWVCHRWLPLHIFSECPFSQLNPQDKARCLSRFSLQQWKAVSFFGSSHYSYFRETY